MPIPKPAGNESEDEFVSRCMSELNSEYPDNEQRSAICYNAYSEEKKSKWELAVEKFIKSLKD